MTTLTKIRAMAPVQNQPRNRMGLAALTALALAAMMPVAAMADTPRTISVTGEGRVEVKPDVATLNIGVRHEAATAREALDLMNAGMAPVIENLIAAGVPQADIQTGGLGLDPVYDYPEYGTATIRGYAAYTQITVVVRDIALVGRVLDAAVTDGANTLGGISFGLADPAAALEGAREAAVADARARAELYAGAAGVELGEILSISENGAYAPQPVMYDMRMEAASAGSVPVSAGQVTITATISAVWDIE